MSASIGCPSAAALDTDLHLFIHASVSLAAALGASEGRAGSELPLLV